MCRKNRRAGISHADPLSQVFPCAISVPGGSIRPKLWLSWEGGRTRGPRRDTSTPGLPTGCAKRRGISCEQSLSAPLCLSRIMPNRWPLPDNSCNVFWPKKLQVARGGRDRAGMRRIRMKRPFSVLFLVQGHEFSRSKAKKKAAGVPATL